MKMAVALVTLKGDELYPKGSQFAEPFPDFIEFEIEHRLGQTVKLVDIVAPVAPVEAIQDPATDPTNASDANTAPTAPAATPEGKARTRGRAK